MKRLGTCRLVDVLEAWAVHTRDHVATDALSDIEFALTYYAPEPWLMGRIFTAEPIACLRVEFTIEDVPQIITHRSVWLNDLVTSKLAEESTRGTEVRRTAAAEEPVRGPLICTCRGEHVTDGLQLHPPYVLVDGWHRGSAWVLQRRAARVYSIAGRIIVTRQSMALLPA